MSLSYKVLHTISDEMLKEMCEMKCMNLRFFVEARAVVATGETFAHVCRSDTWYLHKTTHTFANWVKTCHVCWSDARVGKLKCLNCFYLHLRRLYYWKTIYFKIHSVVCLLIKTYAIEVLHIFTGQLVWNSIVFRWGSSITNIW